MHYQMVRCTILCALVAVATPRFGGASVEMEGFGFEPPPPNLFSFVGAPDSVNATPRNTWPVEIDVATLATSPQMLLLDLPDRSAVLLSRDTWKPRGPGKFLWTGRGDGCSGVFNTIPGHFAGTLACLSGNYRIRSGTAGTHLDRIVATEPPPGAFNDVATVDEPLPPGTESVTLPAHLRSPIVEDRIDVLVLYTPVGATGNRRPGRQCRLGNAATDGRHPAGHDRQRQRAHRLSADRGAYGAYAGSCAR
jgi:hypothetical protein